MRYPILAAIAIFFLNAAVFSQTDIHSVDFKNFTYQPSCTDMEEGKKLEEITVKNGEFSREKKMEDYVDRFYFNIIAVTYGDLNGDKHDEAVILSTCNTGGTGQFTEGFIYTMQAGKPTLLARVQGGDRADGGLRSLTVEDGLLVIDANDASETSGACCPEFAIKTKTRLSGDKLVEVGKGVRRELYPPERVSFAKGTSGKTFTIKLAPEDLKRYVLGAAQGQTLTVSVNTDAASLRLLGGVDLPTDGGTKFSTKLEKTDDYIFEVGNFGVNEITVIVTVRIR